MLPFRLMSDEQLEELLQGCYRYQTSLMVRSLLPAEHRAKYQQYQETIFTLEMEQSKRYHAHPTIAMQDTTHSIW